MLVSCRILINFLFSLFIFLLGAFLASYGFNYIHLLGTLKPQSLAKILYIHYPMDISSLLQYCQTITSPCFFWSHTCFPYCSLSQHHPLGDSVQNLKIIPDFFNTHHIQSRKQLKSQEWVLLTRMRYLLQSTYWAKYIPHLAESVTLSSNIAMILFYKIEHEFSILVGCLFLALFPTVITTAKAILTPHLGFPASSLTSLQTAPTKRLLESNLPKWNQDDTHI